MLSRRDFLKAIVVATGAIGIPIEFDLPDTPITKKEPGAILKFGQGLIKITSVSYDRELIEYPNWGTMLKEYKPSGRWTVTFEGYHNKVYDFPSIGEESEFEVEVPGFTKGRLRGKGYMQSWSESFVIDEWKEYIFTIAGDEPVQWIGS